MAPVSVKLPKNTKQRLARQAIVQRNTAHAVTGTAIESVDKSAGTYPVFSSDALAARDTFYKTGKVYDSADLATYYRAKAVGE